MDYGILASDGATVDVKFVAPLQMTSNAPVFVSDSVSLKRHAVSQKAQRWELLAGLMPESRSRKFFLHNVTHGHTTPFFIRAPQPNGIEKEISKTAMMTASGSAGSSNIYISVGSEVAGKIPAGTFVNFVGHNKLYLLMDDVTGSAFYDIYPALTQAITSVAMVYKPQDVKMYAMYDPDVAVGIRYTDGVLSDPGQLKFIERL